MVCSSRSIVSIGAAILCAVLSASASAHETDNYSLPREQRFVDLGPLFTRIFYRNLDRAVEYTNTRIRQAEESGAPAAQLDELRSPETLARAVRDAFPHTLSLIDDVDRMLTSKQARQRYPGQLVTYEPFDYIYSHSSFILDPRQVFKLWRAAVIKVDGTYMGTDKLGHFVAKGYINYDRYRYKINDDASREEALDYAIAIGTGGDFFYSEKRMVGYLSSGVLSNGDLAADYLGLKFYINLTEPVMLRGEQRPPMVELHNGYFQLADHVRPSSDFFTVYVDDHLNEAMNPSVMEPMMRQAVQKQIAQRSAALLTRYSDRFGNRRSRQWFEQRFRELGAYYGEAYGHESKYDEMITIANSCYPRYEFQSVTDRSPLGRTMLHETVADGRVLLARKAIAEGADVNAEVRSDEPYSSEWGNRPLHYAARRGHADLIRMLLSEGAMANAANLRGVTPLHRAVQVGGESVELLLDAGADVHAADEVGRTPLHWAATYSRPAVVQRLIAAGADVTARDHDRCTPLHYAARWGQVEVIDALLSGGAETDARAAYDVTPLYNAAAAGQANAVVRLIEAGAAVNAVDETGRTALHVAVMRSHARVVEALLARNADAQAADAFGQTPLHEAARNNGTHLARILIDADASLDTTDQFGRTPLHIAGMQGHEQVFELLVQHGGDAARVDADGTTPQDMLHNAEPSLVDHFVSLGRLPAE